MNKIKDFFNSKAENWDNESIPDPNKINAILNISNLTKNLKILDVACGTGVLEEFLLKYSPKKITAIDISENMIKIANEISLGLQPAIDNAILLKDNFNIKTLIDREDLYVIYSTKKLQII